MDENNNLNTNNDFEPVSTDPADIFVDENKSEESDPMKRAEEKFSDPAPEYPKVDDVAEEIPPEAGQTAPTPEQIAQEQYTNPGSTGANGAGPNVGWQDSQGHYQSASSQGNSFQAQAPREESNTLGILSLIFGILSLVFFCSCFNIFTGIAAIIFGIIQLVNNKHTGRGLAIAGIVTAAISIVGFFVFWGAVGGAMSRSMSDMDMDEFWDEYKDFLDDYGIDIEESIPGMGDSAEQL